MSDKKIWLIVGIFLQPMYVLGAEGYDDESDTSYAPDELPSVLRPIQRPITVEPKASDISVNMQKIQPVVRSIAEYIRQNNRLVFRQFTNSDDSLHVLKYVQSIDALYFSLYDTLGIDQQPMKQVQQLMVSIDELLKNSDQEEIKSKIVNDNLNLLQDRFRAVFGQDEKISEYLSDPSHSITSISLQALLEQRQNLVYQLLGVYKKIEQEYQDQNATYYKILNVDTSANQDQLKTAYHELALKYHPDKSINLPAYEQLAYEAHFKAIAHAYGVLSDQKTREAYDAHLGISIFSPKTNTTSDQDLSTASKSSQQDQGLAIKGNSNSAKDDAPITTEQKEQGRNFSIETKNDTKEYIQRLTQNMNQIEEGFAQSITIRLSSDPVTLQDAQDILDQLPSLLEKVSDEYAKSQAMVKTSELANEERYKKMREYYRTKYFKVFKQYKKYKEVVENTPSSLRATDDYKKAKKYVDLVDGYMDSVLNESRNVILAQKTSIETIYSDTLQKLEKIQKNVSIKCTQLLQEQFLEKVAQKELQEKEEKAAQEVALDLKKTVQEFEKVYTSLVTQEEAFFNLLRKSNLVAHTELLNRESTILDEERERESIMQQFQQPIEDKAAQKIQQPSQNTTPSKDDDIFAVRSTLQENVYDEPYTGTALNMDWLQQDTQEQKQAEAAAKIQSVARAGQARKKLQQLQKIQAKFQLHMAVLEKNIEDAVSAKKNISRDALMQLEAQARQFIMQSTQSFMDVIVSEAKERASIESDQEAAWQKLQEEHALKAREIQSKQQQAKRASVQDDELVARLQLTAQEEKDIQALFATIHAAQQDQLRKEVMQAEAKAYKLLEAVFTKEAGLLSLSAQEAQRRKALEDAAEQEAVRLFQTLEQQLEQSQESSQREELVTEAQLNMTDIVQQYFAGLKNIIRAREELDRAVIVSAEEKQRQLHQIDFSEFALRQKMLQDYASAVTLISARQAQVKNMIQQQFDQLKAMVDDETVLRAQIEKDAAEMIAFFKGIQRDFVKQHIFELEQRNAIAKDESLQRARIEFEQSKAYTLIKNQILQQYTNLQAVILSQETKNRSSVIDEQQDAFNTLAEQYFASLLKSVEDEEQRVREQLQQEHKETVANMFATFKQDLATLEKKQTEQTEVVGRTKIVDEYSALYKALHESELQTMATIEQQQKFMAAETVARATVVQAADTAFAALHESFTKSKEQLEQKLAQQKKQTQDLQEIEAQEQVARQAGIAEQEKAFTLILAQFESESRDLVAQQEQKERVQLQLQKELTKRQLEEKLTKLQHKAATTLQEAWKKFLSQKALAKQKAAKFEAQNKQSQVRAMLEEEEQAQRKLLLRLFQYQNETLAQEHAQRMQIMNEMSDELRKIQQTMLQELEGKQRQSLLEEQQDEWMSMIAAFNDDAKKIESKVSVQITPKKTKVDASTQTELGIFKPKKKSISTQTDSEDKKHKKHVHVSEKGGESDTGSQKGSRRKPSYVPSGPLGEPYPNLEPYMKQLLQALVELGITRVTDADIERVYEKTKIEPLRNLHVSYVQGYLQGLIFAPKMYKPLSVLQVEQLLKLLHEASQHRHNKIRQLLQLLREVSNNKQASITKMLQLLRRVNILRNAQLQPSRSMLSGASRARAFEPGYAVATNPSAYAQTAIAQSAQLQGDAQSHIDMTIERARLERTHQSIAQQSFDKPQPLPTILYNQPLPDMLPSGSSSQLVAAPKSRQIARSLVQGLKK